MWFFWSYWIIGCLAVGAGIGLHEKRCPNEDYPKAYAVVATVAIWPASITWAMTNSDLKACKP